MMNHTNELNDINNNNFNINDNHCCSSSSTNDTIVAIGIQVDDDRDNRHNHHDKPPPTTTKSNSKPPSSQSSRASFFQRQQLGEESFSTALTTPVELSGSSDSIDYDDNRSGSNNAAVALHTTSAGNNINNNDKHIPDDFIIDDGNEVNFHDMTKKLRSTKTTRTRTRAFVSCLNIVAFFTFVVILFVVVMNYCMFYKPIDNTPQAYSECGSCHCILEDSSSDKCPPQAHDSDTNSEWLLDHLRQMKQVNSPFQLTCNPYDIDPNPLHPMEATSLCMTNGSSSESSTTITTTTTQQEQQNNEALDTTFAGSSTNTTTTPSQTTTTSETTTTQEESQEQQPSLFGGDDLDGLPVVSLYSRTTTTAEEEDHGGGRVCGFVYDDSSHDNNLFDTTTTTAAAATTTMTSSAAATTSSTTCPLTYHLHTFDSMSELDNTPNAVATHMGSCGVCSNAHDLAAYIANPNMADLGKRCALRASLKSHEDGLRCYKELGLSHDCSLIWLYNSIYTKQQCLQECWTNIFKLSVKNNGPVPTCELNACLKCDEVQSGPLFKKYAGRTRRNSGLRSSIARSCNNFAYWIDHVNNLVC